MVLLVLERPGREPADLLDDALSRRGRCTRPRPRAPAAADPAGRHREAPLVARERLVRQRAQLRVHEHAERDVRLVRVPRVVVDLDAEHASRDADLGRREPGAVRRAHRLDEVVEERLELRPSRAPPRRQARRPPAAPGRRPGRARAPPCASSAGRARRPRSRRGAAPAALPGPSSSRDRARENAAR